MSISRRFFLIAGGTAAGTLGSIGSVVAAASTDARFAKRAPARSYGPLVKDPKGVLDLPRGFQYQVFSRGNDPMTDGSPVPTNHDGMAAFPAHGNRSILIR